MVFRREGLSAESVEALSAAFAEQIQKIEVSGADPDFLQRKRDVKASAMADLFSVLMAVTSRISAADWIGSPACRVP